jgi:hypothetical protein
MNKIFAILFLVMFAMFVKAQTNFSNSPTTQPYGKINKEDLEMKSCDFEKDANAEVLFDKAKITYSNQGVTLERHQRIKILNETGKKYADARMVFYSYNGYQHINNLQAETINIENGAIKLIPIDSKVIYTRKIDKYRSALVFSFPEVRAGSVIECKYTWTSREWIDLPVWYFQGELPTRYCELETNFTIRSEYCRAIAYVNQPFTKNFGDSTAITQIKALSNVPSLPDEPFTRSRRDNTQRVVFKFYALKNTGDNWNDLVRSTLLEGFFGNDFRKTLMGEKEITTNANNLSAKQDKIAFLFNEVKNDMRWDKTDNITARTDIKPIWVNKESNSTEINLILLHFLQKAGIKSYPMLVSTRTNGKVNFNYPDQNQFNRIVIYIPMDSTSYYILDATDKYNSFNEIPEDLLNTLGVYFDEAAIQYKLVYIEEKSPVSQSVFVNAEIGQGTVNGTAEMTSYSYKKANLLKNYNLTGEKKYKDSLKGSSDNMKIASFNMENAKTDTLPLVQKIGFAADLTGSDGMYIYFSPSLFSPYSKNPFSREMRFADIDFGYCNKYSINEIFKIPAGYKIDALPKSVNMMMPDSSITFKRKIVDQDGTIVARYVIDFKKSIFPKDDYQEFHTFFRKMYEMLNEQVVLKKL